MLSNMKRRCSVLLVSWKKTQLPRKKQIHEVSKKVKARKFIVYLVSPAFVSYEICMFED